MLVLNEGMEKLREALLLELLEGERKAYTNLEEGDHASGAGTLHPECAGRRHTDCPSARMRMQMRSGRHTGKSWRNVFPRGFLCFAIYSEIILIFFPKWRS